MKMKKIISVMCASLLLIPLSIGLASCGKDKKLKINAKDVYALSATSSVNYLKYLDSDVSTSKGVNLASASTRPSALSEDNVNGIKNSLKLFDSFIQGGNITQSTAKNTEQDTEFSQYNFVMTISIPGTTDTFKMYFDEIETKTKKEIEDETLEIEVSTTLAGVMVANGVRYDVNGVREFEIEGDETEATIEFTTKSRKNPNNYIVISQSIEAENGENEIEYEYKIYKNGIKIQDIETEIENERNKFELEFQLKDISSGVLQSTVYRITKKGDNAFKIAYRVNGSSDNILVTKTDTGYTFSYSNGFEENIKF